MLLKLKETRNSGKADTEILKKFNQIQGSEFNVDSILSDDILDNVTAKDGTLPGGMAPNMMKALASDTDIVNMLRDPKMQDIMSAVMTGGPDALKKVH